MNQFNLRHGRGFSLLEVLVAVIILSVGLLALALLHLSLMRASTDSKAQSMALAIAKDKLEDLRSFQSMTTYATLIVDSGPATTSQGGTDFHTTTTVNHYALNSTGLFAVVADNASEATLAAASYVAGKDFKWVKVDVDWTEAGGTVQHVILHDIIDGLDPTSQSKVLKNSSTTAARTAKVIIYNPTNATGVIPIAIDPGNNTSTAATNPKPVVDSGGKETRFDVLTYAGLSGGLALAQSKVETIVAACTCDTATAPGGTTARGYRPTYWNGIRYVAPSLTTYVPVAGQSSSNSSTESPYCGICCRDHYDPGTLAAGKPKFDPWRSPHTHYKNNNGTFAQVGVSGQTKYDEACRIIRVDGIFRVAADFNDEYFNLLATTNSGATPYAPSASGITNYQNMVLGYLDAKVTSNTVPSTYNNAVAAATVTNLESTNSINNPASITVQRPTNPLDVKFLHSRGLYFDYLEAEALAAITAAKANCVATSCTTAQTSVAVLTILPFTSINITELTEYSPAAAAAQYISVNNGSFLNSDPDNNPYTPSSPTRGGTNTQGTIPNGAQSVTSTASHYTSNSGLAYRYGGFGNLTNNAIDTGETSKSDTQAFDIPAGVVNNNTGSFRVYMKPSNASSYSYGTPTPTFSGTGVTGSTYVSANQDVNTYNTVSVSDITVPITLTINTYNRNDAVNKYAGQVIPCTGAPGGVHTLANSNAEKVLRCANFTLASGTAGAVSGTSVTNNAPTQKLLSTASITFSAIANNGTVNLIWTGPTYTYAGSCSYNGSTYTVTPAANCP